MPETLRWEGRDSQGNAVAGAFDVPVVHTAPASIANDGIQNVSAALTDWLNTAGQAGDTFQLRRSGWFPTYWIPQGILITRPLTLDLNGCWLSTGLTLGDTDPNFEGNKAVFPPLWPQHQPIAAWPSHRWGICIGSSDVKIRSSVHGGRVQGAGRKVLYRGGFTTLPEGVAFDVALEGQAAIRVGIMVGGAWQPISNVDIDLTNMALEFCHGDGIAYFPGITGLRIHGRQLGPGVVNANIVRIGGFDYLGASGGLGATIISHPDGADRWQPELGVYPGIHHTGRHGFGGDFPIRDLTIEDLSIWRMGRACIDIELSAPGARAHDVTIRRVETGHHQLGWIVSAAKGSIENLLLEDCIAYTALGLNAHTANATPDRGVNWQILRNRGQLARGRYDTDAVMQVDRVDGLEIRDNHQPVVTAGKGLSRGSSTGVVIDPAESVQFPPS
jgi:hypothetical protein